MHIIILVLVVIVIIAAFNRKKPTFVIAIKNGELKITKGSLPKGFLHDFSMALKNVTKGSVIGHQSDQGIKLTFRGDINDSISQRLRNIVGVHQR